MRRHLYRILFLSTIFAGALFYTGHTALLLWRHYSLDRTAPVQEVRWSVVSTSEESYFPQGDYRFQFEGESFNGRTIWHGSFLNEWAAQEYIDRHLINEENRVWFNSISPDRSTLDRHFPYKECFSSLTLWIIGLYFVLLSFNSQI